MKALVVALLFLSPAIVRADLKTLLHGAEAKPSTTPQAQPATVAYAPGATPDDQITSFMMAFAEAVRTGDGALLRTRLSDKYTIDDLPVDHSAPDLFVHAIGSLSGKLEEVIINSVDRDGEARVAKVDFRSSNRTTPRIFKFDAAGKLLYTNFFTLRRLGKPRPGTE